MGPTEETRARVVAVFNSSEDVIEMLRLNLQQAGFAVVSGHVTDIRRGRLDLAVFMRDHEPGVVIYDIGPPYEENWNFVKLLRESAPLRGRALVLTSTNKRVVEQLCADCEVHEVIGKPYDLDQIVRAAREAAR